MDAATATILQLGAAMLAFGAIGLFIVRWTNHRLRGLGWLGGSFTCGFLGTLLLVLPLPSLFLMLGSDLFLASGFALLHTALMDLMTQRPRLTWSNISFVAAVLVTELLRLDHMVSGNICMSAVGLLVAAQCALSSVQLWRWARPAERVPASFSSVLLAIFALYNVFRSSLIVSGKGSAAVWQTVIATDSYAIYIAVSLGLAFGFFWMSTAQLSLQLEHIAGTDPLTRLYNRRTFLKACEKEKAAAKVKQRAFSILMVDLDHFKNINDEHGHGVGDDALMAAVDGMQNAIRGSDLLARWGGEEFAALLPNASLEAARIVAERIRSNVERVRLPVIMGGEATVLRMTVSVGIATYTLDDSIQSVMARADRALYKAKEEGRNRVMEAEAKGALGEELSTKAATSMVG